MPETIIANYEKRVKKVCDKYILMYFTSYSNGRTRKTAKEFLLQHFIKFKDEITSITLDIAKDNKINTQLTQRLFELNGIRIVDFQEKIMDIST